MYMYSHITFTATTDRQRMYARTVCKSSSVCERERERDRANAKASSGNVNFETFALQENWFCTCCHMCMAFRLENFYLQFAYDAAQQMWWTQSEATNTVSTHTLSHYHSISTLRQISHNVIRKFSALLSFPPFFSIPFTLLLAVFDEISCCRLSWGRRDHYWIEWLVRMQMIVLCWATEQQKQQQHTLRYCYQTCHVTPCSE